MLTEPVTTTFLAFFVLILAGILIGILIGLLIMHRRQPDLPALAEVRRRLDDLSVASANIGRLSEALIVPHTRGAVGETLLGSILSSYLPASAYELQYGFRDGGKVDAAIRLGERILPIDAKFPLDQVREAFLSSEANAGSILRRAFRPQIDAIAKKYIRPAEGTLDFALMYVPAERVYYQAFVHEEGLLEESLARRVVPVGPSGLAMYLQMLAFALRGLGKLTDGKEFSAALSDLLRVLDAMAEDTEAARTHYRRLGARLDSAQDAVDRAKRAAGGLM